MFVPVTRPPAAASWGGGGEVGTFGGKGYAQHLPWHGHPYPVAQLRVVVKDLLCLKASVQREPPRKVIADSQGQPC